MVIEGKNIEDIGSSAKIGEYFIYYSIFKGSSHWILYQITGFEESQYTEPKHIHWILSKCIGSSTKSANVNAVSGKIYKLSIKDARVGYRTFLFRNNRLLLKKILGEPTNGYT